MVGRSWTWASQGQSIWLRLRSQACLKRAWGSQSGFDRATTHLSHSILSRSRPQSWLLHLSHHRIREDCRLCPRHQMSTLLSNCASLGTRQYYWRWLQQYRAFTLHWFPLSSCLPSLSHSHPHSHLLGQQLFQAFIALPPQQLLTFTAF